MGKNDADENIKFIEKLMATADDLRSKGKSPLSVLFSSASGTPANRRRPFKAVITDFATTAEDV